MNKRLKVNFVPFSNFGDTLVPYMLGKLEIPFIFTHHTVEKKVLMIGSILGVGSRKDTIVWGSGVIRENIKPLTTCNYRAVRGPRTLEKVANVGVDTSKIVLGDPAMLLPRVYQPSQEKIYKLGIIPHIVDYDHVRKYVLENPNKFPNTIVINANTNTRQIENFINTVNQCEKIVSTSLHGIICAHAYGIPAKWMKVSNKLAGDDIKFYDHFESVGMNNMEPIIGLIQDENIEIDEFNSKLDLESLWNCRPWIDAPEEYYVDLDNPNWVEQCYFDGYKDRLWTDEYFKLR
jgi:pyruvyltransferase